MFYVQSGDVSWNSTIVKEFALRGGFKPRGQGQDHDNRRLCQEAGIRPKVIKIDVEGAEFFVLQGATRTIRDFKPVLILEFNPLYGPCRRTYDRRVCRFPERGIVRPHGLEKQHLWPVQLGAEEAFDESKHATTTTERTLFVSRISASG